MSAYDKEICERILTLSKLNGVEPLPVVALLSLHALADADFRMLKLWVDIAEAIKGAGAGSELAIA
jgi:hypothetical protein